jgi:hypothetical protein
MESPCLLANVFLVRNLCRQPKQVRALEPLGPWSPWGPGAPGVLEPLGSWNPGKALRGPGGPGPVATTMYASDCETELSEAAARDNYEANESESEPDRWAPATAVSDEVGRIVHVISSGSSSSSSSGSDHSSDPGCARASNVNIDFRGSWLLPGPATEKVSPLDEKTSRQEYLSRVALKRCTCRHRCMEVLLANREFMEQAFQSWYGLQRCPRDTQELLLHQHFAEGGNSAGLRCTKRTFLGKRVCYKAMTFFLATGSHRLQRIKAAAPDQRRRARTPAETLTSQQADVFSFLWTVYTSAAELCPNYDVPSVVGLTEGAKADLLAATRVLPMDPRDANSVQRALSSHELLPRKFLPPGHPKQYFWQYMAVRGGAAAGYTVYRKVWHRYFRELLGFTKFTTHPICNMCSELKAKLRSAPPCERHQWAKQFDEHQDDQMRDRQVYYRMRAASMSGDVLTIMQDGSDQAKYRIVRTTRPPKEFDGLWCPKLKLLGSLAHGHVACFWLMEEDVQRSGPDATLESIMTTIELARRRCKASGQRLPRHLWVQLDNTPAENKNRYLLQALAVLAGRGVFETATAAFLRVGHTHEDLDGYWGINQTVLGKVLSWDCPEDILGHTRRVMEGLLSKEEVVVETLDFVRDWKTWEAPLDLRFKGIANGPGSQHFYRFWRRECIPHTDLHNIPDSCAAGLPGDVLMEVKQFMADKVPCQPFDLVLRQGEADLLDPAPAAVLPRRPIEPATVKQVRTMARKMETHYPDRHRAREYLSEWCTRSSTNGMNLPRDLKFLREPAVCLLQVDEPALRPLATGEVPARLVSVQRPKRRPNAGADNLPPFEDWLARRQAQGVSLEQAKREWNGFALINGLLQVPA